MTLNLPLLSIITFLPLVGGLVLRSPDPAYGSGWGGFCDPTPYLALLEADALPVEEQSPSPFAAETPGSPRP